ncbi:MAG: hypothetical protein F6K31_37190 [Symploca sp. SIO2G7]|nr:hypothetical protein [Symploca sp. SIO2G7]
MARRTTIARDNPGLKKLCEELSPKQVKAVVEIAAGSKYNQAAEASGVDVRTVYGWMREPAFKKAVIETVQEIYWASVQDAVTESLSAMKVASKIMNKDSARDRDRLEAVKIVLAHSSGWKERKIALQMETLEARLQSFNNFEGEENEMD